MAEQQKATETTATPEASASAPTAATGTDKAAPERTFSQSELDAAVRRALKTREDNLAAEKAKALKDAETKAALERGDFDKVRGELERRAAEAEATALAVRVEHELKVAALREGIQDVDDVRLLPRDTVAALANDNGEIDRAAVTKAIESLKTAKGYLFKQPAAAPAPATGGGPTSGSAVPPAPTAMEFTEAAYFKQRASHTERVKNIAAPSLQDVIRENVKTRR